MCKPGALTLTCGGRKAHGLLHGLVTEGTPCLCLQAWTCLGGRVQALLEAWGAVGSGDFGGHRTAGETQAPDTTVVPTPAQRPWTHGVSRGFTSPARPGNRGPGQGLQGAGPCGRGAGLLPSLATMGHGHPRGLGPGSPTPLQIRQGSHPDQVLACPGPLSPALGPNLGGTAYPQPGVSQGSESACRVPTAHPTLVPADSTWEDRSLSSGVPAQGRADLQLWLARC